MRTKNKIRSRRTAQMKKEIKNKENKKKKPGSAPLGETGISNLARRLALWRRRRQAPLTTSKMAVVGFLARRGKHVGGQ